MEIFFILVMAKIAMAIIIINLSYVIGRETESPKMRAHSLRLAAIGIAIAAVEIFQIWMIFIQIWK